MKPRTESARHAFSLIELLVVILIIGVLVALLVPAVQRVRASANNTGCINNLKQIGLAMQQYHDTYGHFPTNANPRPDTLKVPPSWAFEILPYIEQRPVYEQGSQAIAPDGNWTYWRDSWAPLSNVAKTPVPTFICPADPRPVEAFAVTDAPQTWPTYSNPGSPTDSWAKTSYLGVIGKSAADNLLFAQGVGNDGGMDNGVFPWTGTAWSATIFRYGTSHRYVKFVDIADGASNTVMIGERPPSKAWAYGWKYYGDWFPDAIWQTRLWAVGSGLALTQGQFIPISDLGDVDDQGGKECPTLMFFDKGDLDSFCHVAHFWSFHNDGGNWLFCDGTVRFLRYSAGTTVIPAMATIAGDEVLPPFE
jgi:prepilin-type N-terminal cleavage/methylation domain-containing protein/prepilin-type processing-associated H-X9-DG protein